MAGFVQYGNTYPQALVFVLASNTTAAAWAIDAAGNLGQSAVVLNALDFGKCYARWVCSVLEHVPTLLSVR